MLDTVLWRFVQIIIDDVLHNERHLAALSFLTFVALDDNGSRLKCRKSILKHVLKNGFMKQHHNA